MWVWDEGKDNRLTENEKKIVWNRTVSWGCLLRKPSLLVCCLAALLFVTFTSLGLWSNEHWTEKNTVQSIFDLEQTATWLEGIHSQQQSQSHGNTLCCLHGHEVYLLLRDTGLIYILFMQTHIFKKWFTTLKTENSYWAKNSRDPEAFSEWGRYIHRLDSYRLYGIIHECWYEPENSWRILYSRVTIKIISSQDFLFFFTVGFSAQWLLGERQSLDTLQPDDSHSSSISSCPPRWGVLEQVEKNKLRSHWSDPLL